MLAAGASNTNVATTPTRYLSSAQPFSAEDHISPFTDASSAVSIQNPTAERVVMKTLFDTLKVSSVERSALVGAESTETIAIQDESATSVSEEYSLQVVEEYESSIAVVSSLDTASLEQEEEEELTEMSPDDTTVDTTENPIAQQQEEQERPYANAIQKKTHGMLVHAIRTGNPVKARHAFHECLRNDVAMSRKYLRLLFHVLVEGKDPMTALKVLQHYRQVIGEPASSGMYASLCSTVGLVDWEVAASGQYTKLCLDLREELVDLPQDGDYQRRCYPVFLVSLVKQPMHRVGKMARGLYNFMQAHDYPLSVGTMVYLLRNSKYSRQDDLPYASILARVVEEGMMLLSLLFL